MKKALLLTLIAALAVAALAAALVPQWMLHPGADHTPVKLARAHALGRLAPALAVLSTLVSLAAVVSIWRQPRPSGALRSSALTLLVIVLWAPTLLAISIRRTPLAERIFAPLEVARAEAALAAAIDPQTMVIGVEIAGEARAYPVDIVGYHHIVHDTVGGEAIAATY